MKKLIVYVNPSQSQIASLPVNSEEAALLAADPTWSVHTAETDEDGARRICRNWLRSRWKLGYLDYDSIAHAVTRYKYQAQTWMPKHGRPGEGYWSNKPVLSLELDGESWVSFEYAEWSSADVIGSLTSTLIYDRQAQQITLEDDADADRFLECPLEIWDQLMLTLIAKEGL